MKINKAKLSFLFSLLLTLCFHSLHCQGAARKPQVITEVSAVEDKNREWDINQAIKQTFTPLPNLTPNYGLTTSAYWFKIKITNNSDNDDFTGDNDFLFKIQNGTITNATFFYPENNGYYPLSSGDSVTYAGKPFHSQFPIFRLNLKPDSSATYLLRVVTNNVMDLPMSIDNEVQILEEVSKDQLFFGIYFGIILVMFFYNIFIYFTVRDKNYLYYGFYILAVGLLQACLKGYASKFLWPNNTALTLHMPNVFIALSGIFSIFFVFNFLNVRKFTPKLYYMLWALNVVYIIGIGISVSGHFIDAQKMLQGTAGLVALTIMTTGIMIYRQGYRPALFFTLSWSFFLTGVIIYILKDAGVFPYNNFTSNSILIGSSLEVALLSFALADKINTYRKEKEESQATALRISLENEQIIREQNVVLEKKVSERTLELKVANDDLSKTLQDLKDAETQLVESEKMASLGQLTAGIAHEINNPINFVTSNVKPLNRDVRTLIEMVETMEKLALDDTKVAQKQQHIEEYKNEIDYDYLKVEIDQLLNGIGEGASRTAEIVKGLRIFSRLDEDDLKRADINEGLESTLIITNNLLDNIIKIEKNYANLPLIECYPGKLNQVFLNMISNAIYAIKKKFDGKDGGLLTITTLRDDEHVSIIIADNGTGMDENTKKRLFEPFFTTKDVGEGTGLGLSIAYNTILKHNGVVQIDSQVGVGTAFTIKLPLIQK